MMHTGTKFFHKFRKMTKSLEDKSDKKGKVVIEPELQGATHKGIKILFGSQLSSASDFFLPHPILGLRLRDGEDVEESAGSTQSLKRL